MTSDLQLSQPTPIHAMLPKRYASSELIVSNGVPGVTVEPLRVMNLVQFFPVAANALRQSVVRLCDSAEQRSPRYLCAFLQAYLATSPATGALTS